MMCVDSDANKTEPGARKRSLAQPCLLLPVHTMRIKLLPVTLTYPNHAECLLGGCKNALTQTRFANFLRGCRRFSCRIFAAATNARSLGIVACRT